MSLAQLHRKQVESGPHSYCQPITLQPRPLVNSSSATPQHGTTTSDKPANLLLDSHVGHAGWLFGALNALGLPAKAWWTMKNKMKRRNSIPSYKNTISEWIYETVVGPPAVAYLYDENVIYILAAVDVVGHSQGLRRRMADSAELIRDLHNKQFGHIPWNPTLLQLQPGHPARPDTVAPRPAPQQGSSGSRKARQAPVGSRRTAPPRAIHKGKAKRDPPALASASMASMRRNDDE